MRTLLAFVHALLALVLAASAEAGEAKIESPAGEWRGDAIAVRWREGRRTEYEPDTVILVENVSTEPVVVAFDWQPRICAGSPVGLGVSAASFARKLFAANRLGINSTLTPGQWDALIFPRGLSPEEDRETEGSCVSRIRLATHPDNRMHDVIELTLPAPPPARLHRE
jgi:hypothetical protein